MRNVVSRLALIWISVGISTCIAAVLLYVYAGKFALRTNQPSDLKVGFPVADKATSYDPAAIRFDRQYTFLMQTLSPLVDYDLDGKLVGALASKFEWVGNELIFTMQGRRSDPKVPIVSADEAAKSLKRLIILASNSHGNITDLLCQGKTPKKLTDPCDGISVRDGKLVLKPGKINTSLVPMLTSQDFAILPSSAYDSESLQIVSYKETSGPYRVASDDENGNIVLEANSDHFHWKENMPQRVTLVPSGTSTKTDGSVSIQNFKDGKVDLITTVDSAKSFDVLKAFKNSHEEVSLHVTEGISIFVLLFSERGMREFDLQSRIAIGEFVREAMRHASFVGESSKPVWTYFPTFGELTRDSSRVQALRDASEKATVAFPLNKPLDVSLGSSKAQDEFWQRIGREVSSSFVVRHEGPHPFREFNDISEMPHLSFGSIDTGAYEDINLVSYTLSSGLFGHNSQQAREWLAKYQNLEHKAERLKMLNEAHFEALEKGLLIPLVSVPYAAVIRKPWKMNFSRFSSTSPLWEVTWN